MVRQAQQQTYVTTENPLIAISACGRYLRISINAEDQAIPEWVARHRVTQSQEQDHPSAAKMLQQLPSTLWTSHPHDVGKIE